MKKEKVVKSSQATRTLLFLCHELIIPKCHTGTLVLWPLTSRMLLLSDQLMYQRVPAVVPTMPMSIVLSNDALTAAPSSIISCSNTTAVPLKHRQRCS